jgi:hypothetical protein
MPFKTTHFENNPEVAVYFSFCNWGLAFSAAGFSG